VAHICNPSTQEAKDQQFVASVNYIVRLYQKTKTKPKIYVHIRSLSEVLKLQQKGMRGDRTGRKKEFIYLLHLFI
jgi:hypothetical protein